MKGREGKGPPSADLLVCFPSRAHLTLMPKPICSPARASEANKRHHHQQQQHHHHHHSQHHHRLKRSTNRGGGSGGQASPLLWAKTKPMSSEIGEPTSPKVTCAGQIKVRHKPNSCKNWQSVMEEIERLHNKKQKNKKHSWVEALGFKKEIMHFLTCLRSIRLDFRCFGSFPTSEITSDEDDEDEDEDLQENHFGREASDDNIHDTEASRTVFSKWFMVLQENQYKDTTDASYSSRVNSNDQKDADYHAPSAPPSNALLLMRCRSAPAKRWLEDENDNEDHENEDVEEEKMAQLATEEEKKKMNDQSLEVMRYNAGFAKLSIDIAKETWLVGGIKDPLSRSRSWKR